MMILRNIIFYLGNITVMILAALCTVSLFFMPFSIRYRVATSWSRFVIFWAKWAGGLSYTVHGKENIPQNGAIIISNHQSTWETLFMQVLLPVQSWVLKRELLFIPFFGWGLYLIEPIAIRRNQLNSITQLIEQGTKRLKQGRFVVIFPEGTRVAPGHLGRFSRSAAALSEASQFPVVPLAHNAGEFWPRGLWIKKTGNITVNIGPVIDPKGKTVTEINEAARNWIKENLPI